MTNYQKWRNFNLQLKKISLKMIPLEKELIKLQDRKSKIRIKMDRLIDIDRDR